MSTYLKNMQRQANGAEASQGLRSVESVAENS